MHIRRIALTDHSRYPLAYAFCVLPLSIIRWAGFVHPKLLTSSHILAPSMVFSSIFNLMGLINTLLIWWTRPAILLIGSDGRLNPNDPRNPEVRETLPMTSATQNTNGATRRGSSRRDRVSAEPVARPINHFGGVNVPMNLDD